MPLDELRATLSRNQIPPIALAAAKAAAEATLQQAPEESIWVTHCRAKTEASVSRQIKLLHERGMLLTRINPAERRQHITEITAKGFKVAEAARHLMGQHLTPKLSKFSEKQIQQLIETLTVLHGE